MLPDPADLAWMEDMRRERARQRWLAEHRDGIDELISLLRQAHNIALRVWGHGESIPAHIQDVLWEVESELED